MQFLSPTYFQQNIYGQQPNLQQNLFGTSSSIPNLQQNLFGTHTTFQSIPTQQPPPAQPSVEFVIETQVEGSRRRKGKSKDNQEGPQWWTPEEDTL